MFVALKAHLSVVPLRPAVQKLRGRCQRRQVLRLNFFGDGIESFVYVLSTLGRCLEELHAVLGCEFLALLVTDGPVGLVALISDQNADDVVGGVLLDLLNPVTNVIERALVGAVVGKDDTHGALVVGLSDGAEALLSGGVPYL